ncbi:unnamed protein product [Symbiodinium natans]|uniref:Pentatricopeptide repeat-containing protein, chloroplastic n=1 Tax=Symbiodinium natans TaxID=878477 RepID=A0A812MSV9_9DINO|nr:unnamed protein product [Symbiodinium natans]
MAEQRLQPNEIHLNACLSVCEASGAWPLAVRLLARPPAELPVHRSTVAYNTTISACEKGHQWELALQLGQQMSDKAAPKDHITYGVCIRAWEKAGLWQHALGLLEDMGRVALQKDTVCCSAAISSCAILGAASLQIASQKASRGTWESTEPASVPARKAHSGGAPTRFCTNWTLRASAATR